MTNLQRLSVHFWYLHLFTQKPDVMHYYVRIKHCCVNVELNIYIYILQSHISMTNLHCCVKSLIDLYSSHLNDESAEIISTFLIHLHLFTQKPDVIHYYVCIKHCCVNVELNRSIFVTSQWRICRDYQYIFDTLHLFTQKPDVIHYYVCIKHCCVNVELNRSIFVTSQWRICRDYQYIFDTFIYLLRNQT